MVNCTCTGKCIERGECIHLNNRMKTIVYDTLLLPAGWEPSSWSLALCYTREQTHKAHSSYQDNVGRGGYLLSAAPPGMLCPEKASQTMDIISFYHSVSQEALTLRISVRSSMMSMSRSICTTQGRGEGLRWTNLSYRPYPCPTLEHCKLQMVRVRVTNGGEGKWPTRELGGYQQQWLVFFSFLVEGTHWL